MIKTVAITGSEGFVGYHLCQALEANKYKIIRLDVKNGFDVTKADCFDKSPTFDAIIHLAARSFVPLSFKQPFDFYRDNYLGTLNVLEKIRKDNARLIFFSSYLYGKPNYLPIDEKHSICPHNPYAHSKLIGEMLCRGYHSDFEVPVVVFRPFNIYGPFQAKSFLIPEIFRQIKDGTIILKDPRPMRDFIYINDVVNAVIKALTFEEKSFEIINLGSGYSISVADVVSAILKVFDIKGVSVKFTNEMRQNEVMDCYSDITKAKNLLQWEPKYSFEKGISEFKL